MAISQGRPTEMQRIDPACGFIPGSKVVESFNRFGEAMYHPEVASSACPVCGVDTPHHHEMYQLEILRAKVAFLEMKLGVEPESAASVGSGMRWH